MFDSSLPAARSQSFRENAGLDCFKTKRLNEGVNDPKEESESRLPEEGKPSNPDKPEIREDVGVAVTTSNGLQDQHSPFTETSRASGRFSLCLQDN